MKRLALWVLLLVALLAVLVGGAAWLGHSTGVAAERGRWQAEQERERLAAIESRKDDERLANRLAARARATGDAALMRANRLQLEALRNDTPLIHVAGGCAPAGHEPADTAVDRPGGGAAVAGPPDASVAPGVHRGAADPVLSHHAVRVWNSALADADTGSGACAAADPASGACAAASGIRLTDAWANHALNAGLCAADRANHRALIEWIEQRRSP